jgi:hypothetical protein
MNIEIYLGKAGQTFGPYTVEQYETLKVQPDFNGYTYIWDGRDEKPDWRSIEHPPGAPSKRAPGPGSPPPDSQPNVATGTPAHVEPPVMAVQSVPPNTASTRPLLRKYDVPGLEALCHDARTVVTGKLCQVTDSGCEFVSSQGSSEPGFGAKSRVMLNLLDPKSGKSMNVPARLNGVQRKDGTWTFRVLWQSCPQLVLQQLENAA